MTFAMAAVAGGMIKVYAIDPDLFSNSEFFGRAISYRFNSGFAIRMAGMFTIVFGTIWFRTHLMPCWMALITLLTALTLLIVISLYP